MKTGLNGRLSPDSQQFIRKILEQAAKIEHKNTIVGKLLDFNSLHTFIDCTLHTNTFKGLEH